MDHLLLALALLAVPAADWTFDERPDGVARCGGEGDLVFPAVQLSSEAFTKIYIDLTSGRFGASGTVKLGAAYPELGEGPAFLTSGKPVRMRVFLDRSLLEVFVNGQSSTGVLTADPIALGLHLFSEGGEAILQTLDVWEMRSVWP